jgi:hypothetical protein
MTSILSASSSKITVKNPKQTLAHETVITVSLATIRERSYGMVT